LGGGNSASGNGAIASALVFLSFGHKLVIESRGRRVRDILWRGDRVGEVMEFTVEETTRTFSACIHRQLVSRESLETAVQIVIHKDAVGIAALSAHVIYTVSISCERATPYDGARVSENGQDAIIRERPFA
jgi:hypothetical protein